MRYDSEHKQRTRVKVLEEAAAAIREDGPDKIGVAGLMAKAGLTHGGFYAHFKSKDDLVAEAITHMFDERFEHFQRCMEGKDPVKGLRAFIDTYLSVKHLIHRDKGCPIAALSGDLVRMPQEARQRFEEGVKRLVNAIATVFKELKKPEPEALAESILAEMVGVIAIARAMTDKTSAENMLESSRLGILRRTNLLS